jgi:hypothetical protein
MGSRSNTDRDMQAVAWINLRNVIILFSTVSRPTLRPTQPPNQCVTGHFYLFLCVIYLESLNNSEWTIEELGILALPSDFCSLRSVQSDSGAHQASSSVGIRDSFPGEYS